MSTLNIKTGKRTVTIRVAKVLEKYPKHAAGLPGIKILDDEGKEHEIAYADCDCSEEEFSEIGPGTEIIVSIQEEILDSSKLRPKEKTISSLLELKARSPLGRSEEGLTSFGWNLDSRGRTGETACELCGTIHPALPIGSDGYTVFTLFGVQIVEQCCGAIIDELFRILGKPFTQKYLAQENTQ